MSCKGLEEQPFLNRDFDNLNLRIFQCDFSNDLHSISDQILQEMRRETPWGLESSPFGESCPLHIPCHSSRSEIKSKQSRPLRAEFE